MGKCKLGTGSQGRKPDEAVTIRTRNNLSRRILKKKRL